MVCPKCGGTDISITEEVYRHSNKFLHGFISLALLVSGFVFIWKGSYTIAIICIIAAFVYALIIRIYSHIRSTKSRTKCICTKCGHKWYIG